MSEIAKMARAFRDERLEKSALSPGAKRRAYEEAMRRVNANDWRPAIARRLRQAYTFRGSNMPGFGGGAIAGARRAKMEEVAQGIVKRAELPTDAYLALANEEITQEELHELEGFNELLHKQADLSGPARGAAYIGLTAGALLAAQGISSGVNTLADRATFNSDFKAMLRSYPSLKKYKENEVREVYQSVRNMNPRVSKDPLIAGTLVSRVLRTRDPSNPSGPVQFDPQLALGLLKEYDKGNSKTDSTKMLHDDMAQGVRLGFGS